MVVGDKVCYVEERPELHATDLSLRVCSKPGLSFNQLQGDTADEGSVEAVVFGRRHLDEGRVGFAIQTVS